jgi:hypothetical protein
MGLVELERLAGGERRRGGEEGGRREARDGRDALSHGFSLFALMQTNYVIRTAGDSLFMKYCLPR